MGGDPIILTVSGKRLEREERSERFRPVGSADRVRLIDSADRFRVIVFRVRLIDSADRFRVIMFTAESVEMRGSVGSRILYDVIMHV